MDNKNNKNNKMVPEKTISELSPMEQQGPDVRSIGPETDAIMNRVNRDHHKVLTKKSRNMLSNVLIVVGIGLIVLPLVLTVVNMRRNAVAMNSFLDETEMIVDNAHASVEDVDSFYQEDVDFQAIAQVDGSVDPSMQAIIPDNENPSPLAAETLPSPDITPSADTVSTKKPLLSKEEIQKRMIGVLYIDKIDVRIPVMTGVDDETLRVAAGRMPESGKLDQIGNVVLAGHRSYTFGKYFNRLDEMEVGDTFTIKTGKKTLEYTVFKTFIVEPDDFSILNYNKTDKICTLFTCHPVVIANKRLVVQAVQTN